MNDVSFTPSYITIAWAIAVSLLHGNITQTRTQPAYREKLLQTPRTLLETHAPRLAFLGRCGFNYGSTIYLYSKCGLYHTTCS